MAVIGGTRRLENLRDLLVEAGDPHLDGIVRVAALTCGAQAAITLVDGAWQRSIATSSGERVDVSRVQSFCAVVLQDDDPVMVPEVRDDPRFARIPATAGDDHPLRSYAGVPLRTAAGEPVGVLCVYDSEPRSLTPTQVEVLELLGAQAVTVLEDRRRVSQIAEMEARIRRLFEHTPLGMAVIDLDLHITDANEAFCAIVERQPMDLQHLSLAELLHPDDRVEAFRHLDRVLHGGGSYRTEHRYLTAEGRAVWVEVWCSLVRDPVGRPLHLVQQVEDIDQRRAENAELAHRAAHDALTGLPNRMLLKDRLVQALQRLSRGGEVVVLSVDLDGFKQVNDTHGHDTGDQVLCAFAERLRENLRPGDTVCRWGGDEFVIVCEDFADSGVARDIAQRIVAAAAQPIHVGGVAVRIGASIGAVAVHDSDVAPERILAAADVQLYEAKRRGRGRVVFAEV